MHPNLKRYRNEGFQTIHGWCSDKLFHTIDLLSSLEFNRTGGCLEIGVHQGKFYLLLNQVISEDARSWAVDLFDAQDLNIDRSGSGSLTTFKANLEKYDVHRGKNTEIVSGDSTDPALDLEGRIGIGSLRFVSVDGGHTVQHTVNDLQLASRLVSNQGVVILDDILNHHWLGVIEGAVQYLSGFPTLVPFAIGHNKLYLCKMSYQPKYFEVMSRSPLFTKAVQFCGHQLAAL